MSNIILDNLIKVEQGSDDCLNFFLTKIDSEVLIKNSNVERLSEGKGVQRYLNEQRANDIAKFCERYDAIFPTPIIVSLNTDFIRDENYDDINKLEVLATENSFDSRLRPFSIIDGQHRLAGIEKYYSKCKENPKKFILPLIIYMDATIETSAKVFVTINANQRSVDSSTISQLFGVIYSNSDLYTVESFASTVVTILNDSEHSPFYHKIKVLGRKTRKEEFISQGTVAKKIIDRITSNPQQDNLDLEKGKRLALSDHNKIFREYFIYNSPEKVAEFMIYYFSAFEIAFPKIWYSADLLVRKAVGFSGLMKFFTDLYLKKEFRTFDQVYLFLKEVDSERAENNLKLIFEKNQGSSESVATTIAKKLNYLFFS